MTLMTVVHGHIYIVNKLALILSNVCVCVCVKCVYFFITNVTFYCYIICDPLCENPAKVFFLDLLFSA